MLSSKIVAVPPASASTMQLFYANYIFNVAENKDTYIHTRNDFSNCQFLKKSKIFTHLLLLKICLLCFEEFFIPCVIFWLNLL